MCGNSVLIRLPGVSGEIVDGCLPRPALRGLAGIAPKPPRPPHFVSKLAEFRIRIFVHSDLFAETLGIQPPSFYEGCIARVLAEFRNPFEFLRERNLQVMPRHGLVK